MSDAHLSIGEVLGLLQDEFPDVTISKIRFLESQGLINPERTPSGYRKFYGPDIERLRWILVQQRENFLPLKVIKERLDSGEAASDGDGPTAASVQQQSLPMAPVEDGAPAQAGDDQPVSNGTADERGPAEVAGQPAPEGPSVQESRPVTVTASMPAGELDPRAGEVPSEATGDEAPQGSGGQPIWMADVAANRGAKHVRAAEQQALDVAASDISLTAGELTDMAGLDAEELRELERFGMLSGQPYADDIYYDADALLIATRAAAFLRRGIEVRHLRMYKVAAEREAGFIDQATLPMLKQRNPEARRQAVELVTELAEMGHDLRSALLRANLRRHLDRT